MASLEEALEKNGTLEDENAAKAEKLAKMRQEISELESQANLNENRLDLERRGDALDAELVRQQRALDEAKSRASIRQARAENSGILDAAKNEVKAEQAQTKAEEAASKAAADQAEKAKAAAGEGK